MPEVKERSTLGGASAGALARYSSVLDELCGLPTRTPRMSRVLDLVRRFAQIDTPVLIQGETGSGKELIARALHALSRRAAKPLVVIDCGALPESLLESELFGHERGAFTGADRSYGGRVQAAAGGTLFLDEVNAISFPMQAKLLRFIDERAFCRVGHAHPIQVDVRLVSASNIPLEELVASGRMRPDFFHRLDVLRIDVPPLRERREDLPLLAEKFFFEDPVARECGTKGLTPEVMEQLRNMPFPGNVRELFNLLRRAAAIATKGGMLSWLPSGTGSSSQAARAMETLGDALEGSFRSWIREREREYLTVLLRRYQSVAQQAAVSGLPERTLYRKIQLLGLRAAAHG